MPDNMIQLVDLYKSFGSTHVLNGLNLEITRNKITVIVGKSGVGKSVLLKLIIGLIEPDAGQILISGKDIWAVGRAERLKLLEKFSYLFQGTALFDSMTVFENVTLPLKEKTRLAPREIRDRFRKIMELVDLHQISDKYPSQLSGGMQKRVALARALITQPETMLFDEPTTGLDPMRKQGVLNMIRDYQEKLGFTGVLVSHAIPDVLYISHKVAFLDEGKIIFQGSPYELAGHMDPVIRQFFEGVDNQCKNPIWTLGGSSTGQSASGQAPASGNPLA